MHRKILIIDLPFNSHLNKGGSRRQGDQKVLNAIRKNTTYLTAGTNETELL